MQTLLTTSKNNIDVYYDPTDAHAATHFDDTPQLKELVIEIIKKTVISGELMIFHTDMGKVVGLCDLVKNDAKDEIFYAKRRNRDVYTSFNKTKKPQPSTLVAITLHRKEDDTYELFSAWIGSTGEPSFPGSVGETSESKPFWTSHSLAWGTQEIQAGTETSVCPW